MQDSNAITRVGWIVRGDQGAPMARAVAEPGYQLHVWVRRAKSLDALEGVAHNSPCEVAKACDVITPCLREDSDIQDVLEAGGLWHSLRPSSVLINHATGLPQFARELAAHGLDCGLRVLDTPVSGGHISAVERSLTTVVGGEEAVAKRLTPVFDSFWKKIA